MPIPRHGHLWTKEDDERLRSMAEASMSLHLIATKLNRSTEGVRARARTLRISFKRVQLWLKAKR
jgi:transposase-like protein